MIQEDVNPWIELTSSVVMTSCSGMQFNVLEVHFNVLEKLFRVLNFHGYPQIHLVNGYYIDLATHKMLRCRLISGDDITFWKLTNAENSVKLVMNNTDNTTCWKLSNAGTSFEMVTNNTEGTTR